MRKKHKGTALCAALLALLCLSGCGGKEQASKPVDVQAVYDSIQKQIELPEMMQLSEKRMRNYYGIEAEECVQALLMVNEAGLSVDEIWLVEAAGEEAAAHIQEVAQSRITQLSAETEKYSPELYEISRGGKVVREGVNVALFISPDAEKMASIYQEALKG